MNASGSRNGGSCIRRTERAMSMEGMIDYTAALERELDQLRAVLP